MTVTCCVMNPDDRLLKQSRPSSRTLLKASSSLAEKFLHLDGRSRLVLLYGVKVCHESAFIAVARCCNVHSSPEQWVGSINLHPALVLVCREMYLDLQNSMSSLTQPCGH